MLAVRDAIPKARDLAKAEFATLRLRRMKIAARVVETASRVRLAFAACGPEADLFRGLPAALISGDRDAIAIGLVVVVRLVFHADLGALQRPFALVQAAGDRLPDAAVGCVNSTTSAPPSDLPTIVLPTSDFHASAPVILDCAPATLPSNSTQHTPETAARTFISAP